MGVVQRRNIPSPSNPGGFDSGRTRSWANRLWIFGKKVFERASERIIKGPKLGESTQAHLQKLGGSINDWGKYATPTYRSPYGNFKVHFYYNSATDYIDYTLDYKVKFNGMTE